MPCSAICCTKHPVHNHYAQTEHLHNWRSYQAKQALLAATWLLAVGAAALSGTNIVDGKRIEAESRQIVADDGQGKRRLSARPAGPGGRAGCRTVDARSHTACRSAQRPPGRSGSVVKLMGAGFLQGPNLPLTGYLVCADNARAENLSCDAPDRERRCRGCSALPYHQGSWPVRTSTAATAGPPADWSVGQMDCRASAESCMTTLYVNR